jgi:hypothetical protein
MASGVKTRAHMIHLFSGFIRGGTHQNDKVCQMTGCKAETRTRVRGVVAGRDDGRPTESTFGYASFQVTIVTHDIISVISLLSSQSHITPCRLLVNAP